MNERTNIRALSDILVEHTSLNKLKAEKFIDTLAEFIKKGIEKNGVVKVLGLGVFKVVLVRERESVHVQTGERIVIPAHHKISFIPDKSFKDHINRPFAFFETVETTDDIQPGRYSFDTENFAIGNYKLEDEALPQEEEEVSENEEVVSREKALSNASIEESGAGEPEENEPDNLEEKENFNNKYPEQQQQQQPETPVFVVPEDESTQLIQAEENNTTNKSRPEESELDLEQELELEPEDEEDKEEVNKYRSGYHRHRMRKKKKTIPVWVYFVAIPLFIMAGAGIGAYAFLKIHTDNGTEKEPATEFTSQFSMPSEEGSAEGGEFEEIGIAVDSTEFARHSDVNPSETDINRVIAEDSVSRLSEEEKKSSIDWLAPSSGQTPQQTTRRASANRPRQNSNTTNRSTDSKQASTTATQTNIPSRVVMTAGMSLTQIALQYYGDKIFWVYIYEYNKDKIKNFDNIPVGTEIKLPRPNVYSIDAKNKLSLDKALQRQRELMKQQR